MGGDAALRAGVLVLIASVALSACATPLTYGPVSETKPKRTFGYSETRASDGRYTVRVLLPEHGTSTMAFEWWERRAAELCGPAKYQKTIWRAERPTVHYDHYGGRPGGYVLEGYVTCEAAPETEPVAPSELAPTEPATPTPTP